MKDLRKRLASIATDRKERRVLAFIGDIYNKVVEVPNELSYVYATIAFNGQVMKVKNNKTPNRLKNLVWLGYPSNSNRFQVLGSAELYPHDPLPDVPHHNHLWGESDNPAWIRQEQFLSGGIPTAAGGMIVQYGGCVFLLDALFHVINNQDFDMTAYIPTDGARWVNVEIDSAKVITYNEGDLYNYVASRELLTFEDIPPTAADKKLLFSVKTYLGQTKIIQGVLDTDIFDPRFSGISTGGNATSIDWDDIIGTPLVFAPDLTITDAIYPRKWIKSAAPTMNDDVTLGYAKSDIWIDQSNGDAYICIDNADGVADWLKVSSGSGGVTSFSIDGRLAVVDNATSPILITSDTTILDWYMYLEELGSSGSTILDIILQRVGDADISIFDDGVYTVLPEIAFDDPDHLLIATPIITDFLAGDILVLNIEQVAPLAENIIFAAGASSSGGGGLGLTVTDGTTTVSNVGQIAIEGGTVIDDGGGEVTVLISVPVFPDYANGVAKNSDEIYQAATNGWLNIVLSGPYMNYGCVKIGVTSPPTIIIAQVGDDINSNTKYASLMLPIPKDLYWVFENTSWDTVVITWYPTIG